MDLVAMITTRLVPWIRARVGPHTERGASLVEYALLIALIVLVCVLAMTFLGGQVSGRFSQIGSGVEG